MRTLIYTFIFLTGMLGISSCSENDTPVFDAEFTSLNIWFGQSASSPLDSVTYNYSYALEEGSLTFIARVAGVPVDYDRSFTLEAVKGDMAEAEGSFRVETYTIPAGEVEVECFLYFDTSKLKNADSFTERDGHLYFRMLENTMFAEGTDNRRELHVVLKNYLAKPDNWDTADPGYSALRTIFGEYSKGKYQFMIQILGLREFKINQRAVVPYDEEANEISYNYANYLKEKMITAVREYNATHDEPLKDSSGALITF